MMVFWHVKNETSFASMSRLELYTNVSYECGGVVFATELRSVKLVYFCANVNVTLQRKILPYLLCEMQQTLWWLLVVRSLALYSQIYRRRPPYLLRARFCYQHNEEQ